MGKITKTVKCTACEKVYRGENAVRVLSAHKRLKHESVIRGVEETSLKRREPPCPADVVSDPIPGPSSSVSRPRYADSSASMIDQNESARGTFLPVAETDIFAHPVRMEEGPSVLSAWGRRSHTYRKGASLSPTVVCVSWGYGSPPLMEDQITTASEMLFGNGFPPVRSRP